MSNTKVLEHVQVMVVDDNSDTCELLRIVLEQAGAAVVVAQNIESAVEVFRKCPSHAVIADIRIGNEDGYDLLKAIREYNANYHGFTPTVAVTGFASPEDQERAKAAGFNAYIAKPFDPTEVVSTVARVLRGPTNIAA